MRARPEWSGIIAIVIHGLVTNAGMVLQLASGE